MDRLWREIGQRMAIEIEAESTTGDGTSVSSGMPWAGACSALAEGKLASRHFRRLKAVKNVVETVGLSDSRFYVKRIRQWDDSWLEEPRVARFDDWGDPIRSPRLLLGTRRAFSPTTLRYLATALWLKRSDKLDIGSRIVEIGVGYGGLAAMNALVSEATTILADLPQVEQVAATMLSEIGLAHRSEPSIGFNLDVIPLVVSNYAFTELNKNLQNLYLEKYLKKAKHGMIISNADVFARSIGGRSDEELITWLNDAGIPARIESENELLSPIDALVGVRLIHW